MDKVYKKTVFITGISSGFGLLVTQKLIDENYLIIGTLRGGATRGKNIFSKYHQAIENEQLIFIDAHLEKKESLAQALDQAKPYLQQGLDILINNAGYGLLGPIEIQNENQIRDQFEVNFFAPMIIIQTLLPYLRKTQGRILNLSSLVGFTVFPFYGTYSASKHAIDSLTEALFYELSEFNIQVCAVEPGGYGTNFSQNVLVPTPDSTNASIYFKRLTKFKQFLDMVQNKLEKNPELVANKIVQLCECKFLPVRVRIGLESHINWLIKKLFPDQWRIQIQNKFYKIFFF